MRDPIVRRQMMLNLYLQNIDSSIIMKKDPHTHTSYVLLSSVYIPTMNAYINTPIAMETMLNTVSESDSGLSISHIEMHEFSYDVNMSH